MLRIFLLFIATIPLFAQTFAPSKVCKKCHPLIYREYSQSMHRNASVANDPVHRAIWQKHPLRAKQKYACAVCHTPTDTELIKALEAGKPALPTANAIQTTEPIGCATCHRIEAVETHFKQNKNRYSSQPRYYFAAKAGKTANEVVKFHQKSGFFGLFRSIDGSPFHTIDYTNAGFANGQMCLGCHDHKRNAKKVAICAMERKSQPDAKQNCITCHMPQVPGSFTTIAQSTTHAYHGFAGLHIGAHLLGDTIRLNASLKQGRLQVTVENRADHKLFAHPLRLGELRVQIERNGKTLTPHPIRLFTILGAHGKPAMPWMADTILKSQSIEAGATKHYTFDTTIHPGDTVTVTLGYHIVNPKAAKKLGIDQSDLTAFKPLVSKTFEF